MQTNKENCFLCDRREVPDLEWSIGSLKFIQSSKFKVCEPHSNFMEKRIQYLEKIEDANLKKSENELPKVYVSKYNQKLPPIIAAEKSFYEREPGEDL